MSPVVSNTTPISNLLRIGQLPLLQVLFGQILISSQVTAKLTRGQPILGIWQEAPGAEGITVIEVKTSSFLH